jgi:hypothetical protein
LNSEPRGVSRSCRPPSPPQPLSRWLRSRWIRSRSCASFRARPFTGDRAQFSPLVTATSVPEQAPSVCVGRRGKRCSLRGAFHEVWCPFSVSESSRSTPALADPSAASEESASELPGLPHRASFRPQDFSPSRRFSPCLTSPALCSVTPGLRPCFGFMPAPLLGFLALRSFSPEAAVVTPLDVRSPLVVGSLPLCRRRRSVR